MFSLSSALVQAELSFCLNFVVSFVYMKITISSNDILPAGEYELTDRNKLENAKNNLSFPQSDRQILIEYDRIAGRIVKDKLVLSPQSLFMLEASKPIEKYSDEELQMVIRQAKNTNIPGSLYQRANNEYRLRQDKKMFDVTKRKKWTSDNVPTAYPKHCNSDLIREVIQDLSEEKYNKLQRGKMNVIWEKIIDDHVKNGERELEERRGVRQWYEKPLGIFILGVLTTIVAGYILFKFGWI